ncbi:MAG: hypothetical protein R6U44_08770 [Archaeoglobaceae archaeon]
MAEPRRCEVCGTRLKYGRAKYCSDFCYKFGSSKLFQVYRGGEGDSIGYCDLVHRIGVVCGVKSYASVDERLTEFFRLVREVKEVRIVFGGSHG